MHTQHARVSIHDAHAVFVPHDWPRPLVQETAVDVEKTREASGGHRVARKRKANIKRSSMWSNWG